MPDMMYLMSNLLAPLDNYNPYAIARFILLLVMLVASVVAIVIVLIQPGNSTGIDALGGSSETFFGKNKGRFFEPKHKMWTINCLAVLAVLAIIFFTLQIPAIWGDVTSA